VLGTGAIAVYQYLHSGNDAGSQAAAPGPNDYSLHYRYVGQVEPNGQLLAPTDSKP